VLSTSNGLLPAAAGAGVVEEVVVAVGAQAPASVAEDSEESMSQWRKVCFI
jgi:hypothetical protein